MGFRGDWKALVAIFNLVRNYNTNKAPYFQLIMWDNVDGFNNIYFIIYNISSHGFASLYWPLKVCWLCHATKGMENDVHMSITNVSDTALWWQTLCQSDPWQIQPNYTRLIGFKISMIVPDLLHCWNLGILRHMLGSSLRIILAERFVFDAPTVPERFAMATESLMAFARQHRYPLRFKKLTQRKVGWKANRYPELACSGYESFVVASWLEKLLEPINMYKEIKTLLWSGNRAVGLMYSAGRFLTPVEKQSLKMYGDIFLQTYVQEAGKAISAHKLLFRVTPKLHLLSHLFVSARIANPSFYSTWMDEDFLKKIGKTLGLTPYRTAQKRLLQRWLLAIPAHLNKNLG